jgi:amidase
MHVHRYLAFALIALATIAPQTQVEPFALLETTIENIHSAYKAGRLTSRQLVQLYLDRIDKYDKRGPAINSILTLNPNAVQDADRLDAAFKISGLTGPLHGIPVLIKDQLAFMGRPYDEGTILKLAYPTNRQRIIGSRLKPLPNLKRSSNYSRLQNLPEGFNIGEFWHD